MGLKDLFIVSDEKPNENVTKEPVKTTGVKFPTNEDKKETSNSNIFGSFGFGTVSTQVEQTTTNSNTVVDSEHLKNAIEMYQKGFESLNQSGYDFYEFLQAVLAGGIDNPAIYSMAFGMGAAMDKTITKDKLLSQSDFYANEIDKVYNDYVTKGTTKRQSILDQKKHENESLFGELSLMRQQLEQLQIQIADRETKLSVIDNKYGPMLTEVDAKILANSVARDKIVGSIQQVKNGIITNLK